VKHGHDGIKATPARFVVHPYKCWLGASWVNDPSVVDCQGIAEFKSPYSKAFDSPERHMKKQIFIVHLLMANCV